MSDFLGSNSPLPLTPLWPGVYKAHYLALISLTHKQSRLPLVAQMVKNLPAMQETDLGSLPGSGRSCREEMATHSSIPAWRIPWTEEHGGIRSMGSQSQIQLSTHHKLNKIP